MMINADHPEVGESGKKRGDQSAESTGQMETRERYRDILIPLSHVGLGRDLCYECAKFRTILMAEIAGVLRGVEIIVVDNFQNYALQTR